MVRKRLLPIVNKPLSHYHKLSIHNNRYEGILFGWKDLSMVERRKRLTRLCLVLEKRVKLCFCH